MDIKMRILVISYSYFPSISPRAFRWTAIAEHWAKQGIEVDVVSAWKPETSKNEIKDNVHIFRTGGKAAEVIRNSLCFKKTTPKIIKSDNKEFFNGHKIPHAVHLIKWLHDYTWKKIYWPDFACLWYFSAVKKAEQLFKKKNYSALITVSLPFTCHLTGLYLKEKYPKINWLVDIGDPFCFLDQTPTNNHVFYHRLNYRCEGKIFNLADAVSVTTDPTLKKYGQVFPDNADKISVIPPLLSQTNLIDSPLIFLKNAKIRLVFIGTLYKNIRSPDYLLSLFNQLLDSDIGYKLELHFFGNTHDCYGSFNKYKELLDKKIFLHGKVSREKAIRAMSEADILINIGNNTAYQLPSKVVEYASTGKPIINLIKAKNDSSLSFFNAYPASFSLLENTENLNSIILRKVIGFITAPPLLDSAILQNWLAKFQVEEIAESYSRLLL